MALLSRITFPLSAKQKLKLFCLFRFENRRAFEVELAMNIFFPPSLVESESEQPTNGFR